MEHRDARFSSDSLTRRSLTGLAWSVPAVAAAVAAPAHAASAPPTPAPGKPTYFEFIGLGDVTVPEDNPFFSVTVRVSDARGVGVQGVTVIISADNPSNLSFENNGDYDTAEGTAVSAADGTNTFRGLARVLGANTYTVTAVLDEVFQLTGTITLVEDPVGSSDPTLP